MFLSLQKAALLGKCLLESRHILWSQNQSRWQKALCYSLQGPLIWAVPCLHSWAVFDSSCVCSHEHTLYAFRMRTLKFMPVVLHRCHSVALVPSGLLHAKRNFTLTVHWMYPEKKCVHKKDITLVKWKIGKGEVMGAGNIGLLLFYRNCIWGWIVQSWKLLLQSPQHQAYCRGDPQQ